MAKVTLDYLREHRNELLAIFDKYHSSNVRIFGSVARGEASEESDMELPQRSYKATVRTS